MLSEGRKEKNRNNLGQQLKDARTREGYTQKALAEALGLEYYTMVSQMELGYMSIPATLWVPISDTLRMDKYRWILQCVKEYQPEVYAALFAQKSIAEVTKVLVLFHKGQLDSLILDQSKEGTKE